MVGRFGAQLGQAKCQIGPECRRRDRIRLARDNDGALPDKGSGRGTSQRWNGAQQDRARQKSRMQKHECGRDVGSVREAEGKRGPETVTVAGGRDEGRQLIGSADDLG
ncbi:hypothetical protein SAMN04488144_12384 [Methylobacterium sp. 190mf]|nr:hypothetical protein SAMN04488144_12384 [Methylobacterium sp. 190mf]SEI07460.1 hypothetical protein SAMN02799636_05327 [Methylobacterium sp. 275MFSha3.1]